METEEIFSSNSSIRQRIGRLGRTCPGEYYYFEYNSYDYKNNQEHNPTELEKMDFTNYLFELLLREGASFDSTSMIMRKLNHNQA
jgi:HrpA-like RNA helicase